MIGTKFVLSTSFLWCVLKGYFVNNLFSMVAVTVTAHVAHVNGMIHD